MREKIHSLLSMRTAIAFAISTMLVVASVVMPARALTPVSGTDPTILPTKLCAIGDSISNAASANGTNGAHPSLSWTAGTSTSVNSIASRLEAARGTTVERIRYSVGGSTSQQLASQATSAINAGCPAVTIEMGGNDACAPDVAGMTPVSTYQSRVSGALTALENAGIKVMYASVPSLLQLWDVNKDNASARAVWLAGDVCQNMLADPTSNDANDVQRRAAVEARIGEYNDVIEAQCATRSGCSYDGDAVYNTIFTASDVSTYDYFHPSTSGQAKIAASAWRAAVALWPGVLDETEPNSSIMTAPSNNSKLRGSITLRGTATDNTGVTSAKFYLDSTELGSATLIAGEWRLPFNTTLYADGSYVLKMRAYDAHGNVAYSAPLYTAIDNTQPTPTITSPTPIENAGNQAFVSRTTTVTGTAIDANLSRVELQVIQAGTTTVLGNATLNGSNWTYNWDTVPFADGVYDLKAKAIDTHGNTKFTGPLKVYVSNAGVRLLWPTSGSTLTGSVTFTVYENVTATNGWLYRTNVSGNLCNMTKVGTVWQCTVDTTTLANGTYTTFKAKFRDAANTYYYPAVTNTYTIAN